MRVIIESPYAPRNGRTVDQNIAYALECLRHSLSMGEAPLAFHLLYPRVLDDFHPVQRAKGIERATRWYHGAERVSVYQDYGISPGMLHGIKVAENLGIPIVYRNLPGNLR